MHEVRIYRPNQDKNLELFKVISKEEVADREIAKILKIDEFEMSYRENIYTLYQIRSWKNFLLSEVEKLRLKNKEQNENTKLFD